MDWREQVDDILAHYGVKGMKWGVRRAIYNSPRAKARRARTAARNKNKKPFLQGSLNRLYRRMSPEQKANALRVGRNVVAAIAIHKISNSMTTKMHDTQAAQDLGFQLGTVVEHRP